MSEQILFSPPDIAVGRARPLQDGLGFPARFRSIGRRTFVGAALLLGDLIAAWLAAELVQALVHLAAQDPTPLPHLHPGLIVLVFLAQGLYSGSGLSPCERFRLRGIGVLLFVALDFLVVSGSGGLMRVAAEAACAAALLVGVGFYMELLVKRALVWLGPWMAPAALVGCSDATQRLYRTLAAQPELGLRPVGFIATDTHADAQPSALPLPLLGTIEDFARASRDVEVAILTTSEQLSIAGDLADPPSARLVLLSDVQDAQMLWLRPRTLGNAVGLEFRRDPYLAQSRLLKRAIDLAIAVPAAVLTAPLIGVLALLIKMTDRGPAFYVQSRVGQCGRPINVPKLRTMYKDASRRLEEHLRTNPQASDEWQRYFKLSNDPRILPRVGNFIRRASLDELPQLWSVITGDMSLVGPRPFPAYHVDRFDAEFQHIRTTVPPGLTGLWQVSARSDGDLDVQQAQDTFYIRNWSIWLDLYILLQTIPAVMSAKGAK